MEVLADGFGAVVDVVALHLVVYQHFPRAHR
jgi:hypothetical protein